MTILTEFTCILQRLLVGQFRARDRLRGHLALEN